MSLYLPILMYHQVGRAGPGDKSSHFVSPERFREHLAFLADSGYRPVTPDALCAALVGGARLPERPFDNFAQGLEPVERPVLLTFDDANAPRLRPTAELLAGRGFPAVFYFNAASRPVLPAAADLDVYRRAGLTVGSHCVGHPWMPQLSDEQLRFETEESRRRLEDLAGGPVVHFAYPFGAYGRREIAAVRAAGYHTAVSVRKGNRHRRSDRFCLRRIPVRSNSGAKFLARVFTRSWHLEYVLKDKLGLLPRRAPPPRAETT